MTWAKTHKKVVTNCDFMSCTKRITDEAEQYVSDNQKKHETWMEALDRLLGLDEQPLTEERVREIANEEIDKRQQR